MRIPITNTELIAMPNVAWRKFHDFLLYSDTEYTPFQKTAALCLRYCFGTQGGGHRGFFEYYEDIDKDELAQALRAIGAPEFASNFIEAVENGEHDNYGKTDAWFFDNTNTLLRAVEEIRQNNTDEFYEIVDENYTVTPRKDGFWVGAIIVAVVCVFMFIAANTNPNPEDRRLFILISVVAFALTALTLVLYAKRWKISVKKDVLTARFLFVIKRTARFGEISDVRERSKDIIVYANGRRLIKVGRDARWFGMFFAQLSIADSMVDQQRGEISIRLPKANMVNGCIWPLIGVSLFVWTFWRDYNPANIYEKVFFSAAMLASLWYFLCCWNWRIIVSEDSIGVKKAFRNPAEYQIGDIAQVNIEKQKMIILVNGKTAAKIAEACEGYHDFVKILQSANIPFYGNGKRIRYEEIPVEEQLAVLGSFGIAPKREDFVEWLRTEWGTEVVKADPYYLLMFLGGNRRRGEVKERLSDDVLSMDTECVNDGGSYKAILEQLAALAKGAFAITGLHGEVDPEGRKASVSFNFNNRRYEWEPEYKDDWFDSGIIWKINDLLMSSSSARFFYTCQPPGAQGLIVVFSSEEVTDKLNLLTDYPFVNRESAKITSNFIVKRNRSNIKGSIFSIAVFGGFLILLLLSGDMPLDKGDRARNLILYGCLFAFVLLGLTILIDALRWRLTMSNEALYLRKIIGGGKTYAVKSITRTEIKTESIIIRVGKKKIRVMKNCENFPLLIARLESEKIPFYNRSTLAKTRRSARRHRSRG